MGLAFCLFVDGLDAAALRAIRDFRALVDGPWSDRGDWTVVDVSAEGEGATRHLPARLPALWSGSDGEGSWRAAEAISREAEAYGVGAPPPGAAAAREQIGASSQERIHVRLLDRAPSGAALFLESRWLVYANPAFRAAFELLPGRGLGRAPTEWIPAGDGRRAGLEEALRGSERRQGILVERLAGPGSWPLTLTHLTPIAGERAAAPVVAPGSGVDGETRALLGRIRTANHAIGNALVGVMGYAELLQRDLASEPAVSERLDAMIAAAQRVDDLSRDISRGIGAFLGGRHET
jgi:PAS domain-containing protein